MHVRVHLAGTAHITWWPMFTPFKISSSQRHHLLLHIDSGKKRYIILKPLLFSWNDQKIIKSGSVTIKGQFTVQKAALEDPSNLKCWEEPQVQSVFLLFSVLLYPSAEGFECSWSTEESLHGVGRRWHHFFNDLFWSECEWLQLDLLL